MFINFTKMQGLGNDFVVIDLITQQVKLQNTHIKQIADRHFGIGCDQVILIEPPIHSQSDFYYRIFNANGQEVEQCGNGARCAARFFYENRLTNHRTLQADCLAGAIECMIEADKTVTLNLGKPIFKPEKIPFIADQESLLYPIEVEGHTLSISVLSVGNPHAIIHIPHLDSAFFKKIGPALSTHARFPNEVNVGFMEIVDRAHIRLKTFERGVGETLSCGTNSCAAAIAGLTLGLLDSPVYVAHRAGKLKISWTPGGPVYLTGPAAPVFTGCFPLN